MAQVGQTMNGKVVSIKDFGAFVDLENGEKGLVHISEISNDFVSDIKSFLSEGQKVFVKVMNIDEKGRINLSIKRAENNSSKKPENNSFKKVENVPFEQKKNQMTFEDMMAKFKQESESKLADIKQSRDIRISSYAKRR